jgi:hypothetical protein
MAADRAAARRHDRRVSASKDAYRMLAAAARRIAGNVDPQVGAQLRRIAVSLERKSR